MFISNLISLALSFRAWFSNTPFCLPDVMTPGSLFDSWLAIPRLLEPGLPILTFSVEEGLLPLSHLTSDVFFINSDHGRSSERRLRESLATSSSEFSVYYTEVVSDIKVIGFTFSGAKTKWQSSKAWEAWAVV